MGEGDPFVLVRTSADWPRPTYIVEGILLYSNSCIKTLISFKSTLTEKPRVVFERLSGYPVAQSSWHIKLTLPGGINVFLNSVSLYLSIVLYTTPVSNTNCELNFGDPSVEIKGRREMVKAGRF